MVTFAGTHPPQKQMNKQKENNCIFHGKEVSSCRGICRTTAQAITERTASSRG